MIKLLPICILLLNICFSQSSTQAPVLDNASYDILNYIEYRQSKLSSLKDESLIINYYSDVQRQMDSSISLGQYKRAIEIGKKLVYLSIVLGELNDIPKHLNQLNYPAGRLGNYPLQYQSAKIGVLSSKITRDTSALIISLGHLANFYNYIDNVEEAVKNNRKAVYLSRKSEWIEKIPTLLNNRSMYYTKSRDFNNAKLCAYKAKKLAQTAYDSIVVYQGLGIIHFEEGSYDQALFYFNSSYDIINRLNSNKGVFRMTHDYFVGSCYFEKNEFDKSLIQLNKAQTELENNNTSLAHSELLLKKSKIYDIKGRLDSSYYYLHSHLTMKDSLIKMNDIKNLTRIELNGKIQNQLEKQKIHNLRAELVKKKLGKERQENKHLIITSTLLFILLIVISFAFQQFKRAQELRKREVKLQFEREMELKDKQVIRTHVQHSERVMHMHEGLNKMAMITKSMESPENVDSLELEITKLSRKINLNVDKEWEDFKLHFEKVHNSFFKELNKRYPQLSSNDEKILAYIKVNMSTSQIAGLLNVQDSTIHTKKYRLRKKMKLPKNADIKKYLDFS